MKAMILAAGFGSRMRPLTLTKPKPLLEVKGCPLIEYHIKALAQAGVKDIVINHAYLGQQIVDYLGDGSYWNVNIKYSAELEPLETAGGLRQALPLIDPHNSNQPFIVVNADVFTDFDFSHLPELAENNLAHLLMVPNPPQHQAGDFLVEDGCAFLPDKNKITHTFSGISLLRPELLALNREQKLAAVLRQAMALGRVSASIYKGFWSDIGTPERLAELNL